MARNTQNRTGTSFTVTYPDFPNFSMQPRWFKLHQEKGKQDVIEIAYSSFNTFYQQILKTGVLLQVDWSNEKSTGKFTGYVYSTSMTTQATLSRNIIVRGVGASFRLKDGGSKVWKNKTAPEIIAEICKEKNLKAAVTKSTVRFGQQSLVGQTRWEKVQELAERIGFVCQMIGVELHFHPIDTMIDLFSTSIPVLEFADAGVPAGAVYEAHTLDMFKPTTGNLSELSGHSKKLKTVSGIDAITGKTFNHKASPQGVGKKVRKITEDPLFSETIPTRVAETPAVARAMAEGFAQLARFSVHAEGAGQGDSRIAPYRTVEINGTGEATDGFWVITRATHFVHMDGRYTVEFSCMTDGTGKNSANNMRPDRAGLVPTRNVAMEMATGMTTRPTVAKISKQVPIVSNKTYKVNLSTRKWVG